MRSPKSKAHDMDLAHRLYEVSLDLVGIGN